jgi:hypothetical protein
MIILRDGGPGEREEHGELVEVEGLSLGQNAAGQPKLIGGAAEIWGWDNPRVHPGALYSADFGRSDASYANWITRLEGGKVGTNSTTGTPTFDATFVEPFGSHKPLRLDGDNDTQRSNIFFVMEDDESLALRRLWMRSAFWLPTGMPYFYLWPGPLAFHGLTFPHPLQGEEFPDNLVLNHDDWPEFSPAWWPWNHYEEPIAEHEEPLAGLEGKWTFCTQLVEMMNPGRQRLWTQGNKKVDFENPNDWSDVPFAGVQFAFGYSDQSSVVLTNKIAYGLVEVLDADRYENPYGHAL